MSSMHELEDGADFLWVSRVELHHPASCLNSTPYGGDIHSLDEHKTCKQILNPVVKR